MSRSFVICYCRRSLACINDVMTCDIRLGIDTAAVVPVFLAGKSAVRVRGTDQSHDRRLRVGGTGATYVEHIVVGLQAIGDIGHITLRNDFPKSTRSAIEFYKFS